MVGQLGFWVSFIAMQALMAELTDSDGFWLGLLFFVSFVPSLVFTPIAGVVADRVDRQRILVVGYLGIVALMSVMAIVTFGDHMTPSIMLPFAGTLGVIFAFNAPASQAMTANTVPAADVASAVSLNSVGGNLARVVGPTIAAPVVAIWNEGVAFAIYAIASLVVVLRLRRLRLTPFEREAAIGGLWWRMRGGWHHAKERPPAVAALSLLCMSSLFAGAYLSVLPVLADDAFDRGPRGFTVLAAMTGLGSMFGALTTGFREGAPTMRSAGALVVGFGTTMMLLAVAPSWPVALLVVAVLGYFYFWAMTSLNALLQHLAADSHRGRLMSLFHIGWAGLVPIGALWQGAAITAIGVRPTVALAGAITTAYAAVVALQGVRSTYTRSSETRVG